MVRRKFIRVFATLVVVICVGITVAIGDSESDVLAVNAHAADTVYNMTDEYKESKFYKNLMAVNRTGDQQKDVVAIALSQLGYHEGDSPDDFDGMSTDGTRDFVEYNVLFGELDNDQGNGNSYGYYWCASFVNWCLRMAGVSYDASATAEVSCQRWLTACREADIFRSKSGYSPKSGDMIFFKDTWSSASATHVGLVIYTNGGRVYTVEGNTSGDQELSSDGEYVATKSYDLNSQYIVGYATPRYNEESTYKRVDHSAKLLTQGQYISAEPLSIYSDKDISDEVGTVEASTLFSVNGVDGQALAVTYTKDGENAEGYVKFSESVKQVTSSEDVFRIRYFNDDGTEMFYPQYRLSKQTRNTYGNAPTREKSGFVGWKATSDKAETVFEAGEPLPTIDRDIDLYAVWDSNFYVVTFKNADGTIITQEHGYYGTVFEEPAAPDVPEGYVFDGWGQQVDTTIRANASYTAQIVPEGELDSQEDTQTDSPDTNGTATGCVSSAGGVSVIAAAALVSAYFSLATIFEKRRSNN